MIQKCVGFLLALSLLLATGCSHYNGGDIEASGISEQESISIPAAEGSDSIHAIPLAAKTEGKPGIDTGKVKGDIQNIFYADGTTVLILADKLYLYDLATGTIHGETAREAFYSGEVMHSFDDGYALIGQTSDGTMDMKIVFYDKELKKLETLSMNAFGHMVIEPNSIAVSSNGRIIVYQGDDGIYRYDRDQKKTVTLVDGLNLILEQVRFIDGNKKIVFMAESVLADSNSSVTTCGILGVDGSGLVNKKPDNFLPYSIAGSYDDFALFSESSRKLTGKLLSLNTSDCSMKTIALATQKEGAAFGSDGGDYFATSSLSADACTVRVYRTQTGKLVLERKIPHGGNSLYVAREPEIRVIDEAKTCIVLMGNRQDDLSTKVTIMEIE